MKAKKQNVLFTLLPFYLFTFKHYAKRQESLRPERKGVYAGKTLPTDQGWNDHIESMIESRLSKLKVEN